MSAPIFKAYRYQLLPLDRNRTKDLYRELSLSTEQLIERKNNFFAQAIGSMSIDPRLKFSIERRTGDLFKIKIAPSRPLTRETQDSKKETIENWPHVDAYILNHPDDQILLIQDRSSAFSSTDVVVGFITKGTRHQLENVGLSLHIKPMFDENFFWNLAEIHKNKITSVEFQFITPNMANISKTLAQELKDLGKQTNASMEQITLRSQSSTLDLSKSNKTLQGLVEYTSQGAGNISVKVQGLRKRIKTSDTMRSVQLSELELSGSSEDVVAMIRDVLK